MPLSPLAFRSATHTSHAVVSQWPPLLQETIEDGYYDQQRLLTHPQSMEVTTGGGGTRTGGLILIFKADSCWDLPRGNLTHFLDAKGGFLCVLIKLLRIAGNTAATIGIIHHDSEKWF